MNITKNKKNKKQKTEDRDEILNEIIQENKIITYI